MEEGLLIECKSQMCPLWDNLECNSECGASKCMVIVHSGSWESFHFGPSHLGVESVYIMTVTSEFGVFSHSEVRTLPLSFS